MAPTGGSAAEQSDPVQVSALAITVEIPELLQWNDFRRGQEFRLTTLTVRLLPDGSLAAKAYGRPVAGGRGAYTSFAIPESAELAALIESGSRRAARLWDGATQAPAATTKAATTTAPPATAATATAATATH